MAEKKPNPWGLYDMNGNVRQWCADYYSAYKIKDFKYPESKNIGQNRVLRGGSWFLGPNECRSAYRFSIAPQGTWADDGLRMVLRVP